MLTEEEKLLIIQHLHKARMSPFKRRAPLIVCRISH